VLSFRINQNTKTMKTKNGIDPKKTANHESFLINEGAVRR